MHFLHIALLLYLGVSEDVAHVARDSRLIDAEQFLDLCLRRPHGLALAIQRQREFHPISQVDDEIILHIHSELPSRSATIASMLRRSSC